LMVHTRSTNPEILRPDFSAQVTPPRTNNPSVHTSPSSSLSSAVFISANMSQNPFGSPSVPNPSPYANIYPPLSNFPPISHTMKTAPLFPDTGVKADNHPQDSTSRPTSVTPSKGKEPEEDQLSQGVHASSLDALNDVVREEIRQNRGTNLDSDLFSVDPALRSSLNGMNAHGAYSSLSERFANPSWSLLLGRCGILFHAMAKST
ncbi:hypothetical protein MJO28_016491, partial [Puccinia striiformis f. sp. tritici]